MTAHHEQGQSLVECAGLLIRAHEDLERQYLAAENVRVAGRQAIMTLGRLATYQIMNPYLSRVAGCLAALGLCGFSRANNRDENVRLALHNIKLLQAVLVDDAVGQLDSNASVIIRHLMGRYGADGEGLL